MQPEILNRTLNISAWFPLNSKCIASINTKWQPQTRFYFPSTFLQLYRHSHRLSSTNNNTPLPRPQPDNTSLSLLVTMKIALILTVLVAMTTTVVYEYERYVVISLDIYLSSTSYNSPANFTYSFCVRLISNIPSAQRKNVHLSN